MKKLFRERTIASRSASAAPTGIEQRRRAEVAPVRHRKHERADAEAEQAAPRERRRLDDEQEGDQRHQPPPAAMILLQPQVERGQDQQRHDQHDPEVVRVAGHRVRPVDVRAVDRAVDVDLAGAAGDRREHRRVEVRATTRVEQLQHAVDRVDDDPAAEPRERAPEVRLAAPSTARRRRRRGRRSGSPTSSGPSPTARARRSPTG